MVDTCRFTASPFYNSTNTPYRQRDVEEASTGKVDSLRVCALINIFLIFRFGNYLSRLNSTFKEAER
jgi:hypothetical protein